MKLLFDENLSDALVGLLADEYPQAAHVKRYNLVHHDDGEALVLADRLVVQRLAGRVQADRVQADRAAGEMRQEPQRYRVMPLQP